MSHAVKALILIRLDARVGEWVTVDELARHLDMQPAGVAAECQRLADERHIHVRIDLQTHAVIDATSRASDLEELVP